MSITIIVIALTVIVSLAANQNADMYYKLLYNPYNVIHRKEWYRIFSHALIHDRNTIAHLLFNMYVLYSFGEHLSYYLSFDNPNMHLVYYLFIYVGGVFAASIPSLFRHKDNPSYNAVGASGAVSAILFSTIAFTPLSGGIGIIFIPGISIPPLIFGVLYIAYELYMDKQHKTNIAHDAHIFGGVYGFVFTLLFIPSAKFLFLQEITNFFGWSI